MIEEFLNCCGGDKCYSTYHDARLNIILTMALGTGAGTEGELWAVGSEILVL